MGNLIDFELWMWTSKQKLLLSKIAIHKDFASFDGPESGPINGTTNRLYLRDYFKRRLQNSFL